MYCVYRPDPGLCFCCISDQANRWSPCVVVLGCQWTQVDDATPRSWPLNLLPCGGSHGPFANPSATCRSRRPGGQCTICPPARMATASMAGAVKASYPVHAPCPHEITGITRPAVCASAGPWQWPPCVQWTRKGNWQPHRRADVARHWQVGVTLFTCSVLVGMAIVAIAFIQLA